MTQFCFFCFHRSFFYVPFEPRAIGLNLEEACAVEDFGFLFLGLNEIQF